MMHIDPLYQPVWEKAKPYLATRSNDVHTLYAYHFARQLLEEHPEADTHIVIPTVLLHDVGWSTVSEDKQLQAFGPRMIYPELRRQHETEGVRIAQGILQALAYDPEHISKIVKLIDGHDTRKVSRSRNDSLLRDADKLWVYTPFGMQTVSAWFEYDTEQYMTMLDEWLLKRFYTDAGRHMARALFINLQLQNEITS